MAQVRGLRYKVYGAGLGGCMCGHLGELGK